MGPALKPFGGAWSDAVRRDAQREEALHSKKLDASGADRRRAAKALRRQQVVDRLLQRLAQDRMKVEAERVANEAASEGMQDILDRMEEELRAESAPPPRSPLETVRSARRIAACHIFKAPAYYTVNTMQQSTAQHRLHIDYIWWLIGLL